MQPQGRRKTMRTLKEIARLHLSKQLRLRQIGRACNLSVSTVQGYVKKIEALGLDYASVEQLNDVELQALLSPAKTTKSSRPMPDMEYLNKELSNSKVTLNLLYEEYLEQHPTGYGKTQFYALYNAWAKKNKATLRLTHKPGEVMFIDFSGDKPSWIDPLTGAIMMPELYVAVLGGSSFTFACAVASQKAEDFVMATIKALEYCGGCPETLVIDNLKSGVTHACYYDPEINPTFADMALHYNLTVLPTRVRKPKDKAVVESAVLQAQRRIIARLRHRQFFSLEELNVGIAETLEELNNWSMQLYGKSRRQRFIELEQGCLTPLPQERYVMSHWKKAKVHVDYHVMLEKSFYSVPYRLIGKQVDIRDNRTLVTISYQGTEVAQHIKTFKPGHFVTDSWHMPHEHKQYMEWSPERIRSWADKIGPNTALLIERIMQSKVHPEHAFRGCLGIIRLAKTYTPERLEQASAKALSLNLMTYRSIKSMMSKGLDKVTLFDEEEALPALTHQNIRGGGYYAANH